MTTERIINWRGATLEVEHYYNSRIITINVDDPTNLRMDNNYNGDSASVDFNAEQVRELHACLTQILATWEAEDSTN